MAYGDPRKTGRHPAVDPVQEILHDFKKNEVKQVVKDAIKEWLDEQAAVVGKWSIRFILMTALSVLAYLFLTNQGWVKA